ncbi:hypothetical protein DFH28DRAFT_395024 [Melampsora americana]|nr:hypothetical protein DFH28DRAFT_395024 [Melampsora americana]
MSRSSAGRPTSTNTKISSLVSLYEEQALKHTNSAKRNQTDASESSSTGAGRHLSPLPQPPVFKFCSPVLTTVPPIIHNDHKPNPISTAPASPVKHSSRETASTSDSSTTLNPQDSSTARVLTTSVNLGQIRDDEAKVYSFHKVDASRDSACLSVAESSSGSSSRNSKLFTDIYHQELMTKHTSRGSADFHHVSKSSTEPTFDSSPLLMRGESTISSAGSKIGVPAHRVFTRGAPALLLPALDELLESIEDACFEEVSIDDMSGQEASTWRDWLRGTCQDQSSSSWNPFHRTARGRKRTKLVGNFTIPLKTDHHHPESKPCDSEQDSHNDSQPSVNTCLISILPKLPSEIPASRAKAPKKERIRRLIFLPMHLLPANLTISDLKLNRSASAPLLSMNDMISLGIDTILEAEDTSYAMSLMNIEMFRDMAQMIGLLIGFRSDYSQSPLPRTTPKFDSAASSNLTIADVLFGRIPAIVGLDFVGAFGKAVLWFWIFGCICSLGLYEFYRLTGGWKGPQKRLCNSARFGEGFDMEDNFHNSKIKPTWRQSKTYITTITFLLTSFYVPLSKISIGALAWTSDFWAIPNPYLDSDQPQVQPLGPSDLYRDTLDFCYTTTMKKPQGAFANKNWTVPIILVSIFNICTLSIWFPLRLWKTVKVEAPKVDEYTELGEKRKAVDQEYQRLVDRDQGPFVYLYSCYRRRWSGFKAFYMVVKLVTILIGTLMIKDNCLFRNFPRDHVNVFREGISMVVFVLFLAIQMRAKPFIHPTQNASETVGRLGFLVISFIALLVALKVKGSSVLGGPVLVVITALIYILDTYFTVIRTAIFQRVIKRYQKRLDFSIDLFSPHLDLAKHISRRVWQETICTILLALPEYKIMNKTPFKWSEENTGPPYLLGFKGTQGERLIENLKILRTIGLQEYTSASAEMFTATSQNNDHKVIRGLIIHEFTGPDCFWKPRAPPYAHNVTTFFGRADVVPFPFTVIFRYDQSPDPIFITKSEDLQAYVNQNNTMEILMRRQVRLLLRSLEGQEVFAPFTEEWERVKGKKGFLRRNADPRIHFRSGILKIRRNCDLRWRGYNYNSGFDVTINYCDGQSTKPNGFITSKINYTRNAHSIGLLDDFKVSPDLARIFQDNKHIISTKIGSIQTHLKSRRDYFATQFAWKLNTMSYSFLLNLLIREENVTVASLTQHIKSEEVDSKMRCFPEVCRGSLRAVEDRLQFIHKNKLTRWWYTFFDDVYRRNAADVPALSQLPSDFSPHYRSSICYRPMSRKKLEDFLIERKLATVDGRGGFFHSGLLNRMYFYLDEMMFEGTSKGISIRVGDSHEQVKLECLPSAAKHYEQHDSGSSEYSSYYDPYEPSRYSSRITQFTGEGTDEGDPVIRFRNAFAHEQIFDQTSQETSTRFAYILQRVKGGISEWLGLVPVHHARRHSAGISLGLRRTTTGFELPRSAHSPVISFCSEAEEKSKRIYDQIDPLEYGYP